MTQPSLPFKKRVAAALEDSQLRTTQARASSRLRRWRREGLAETDFAALQAAARELRRQTLADLPALLDRLEERVAANGGIVYRAHDAAAVNDYILALIRREWQQGRARQVPQIVKSKSAISEEIDLNAALQAAGIQVVETQLGDYIVQLGGEMASHPIFPALHCRKEDVAALFEARLDMPQTLDIQVMASMARFKLRQRYLQADVGISGVDFAVAETGSLALSSQSGDEAMTLATPRIVVTLMGLEQVVPSLEGLLLLLQAFSLSASGQPIPGSVSLLNGPARPGDPDGPEELHLIIVDNGRSELLQSRYRDALACIRCGACLNVCPVYQEIGGQAYGAPLSGPIGSVVIPLRPMPPAPQPAEAKTSPFSFLSKTQPQKPLPLPLPLRSTPFAELPQASTLCGACAEVCPVGIDIPGLLLALREDLAEAGRIPAASRLSLRLWLWAMADAGRYQRLAGWLRLASRLLGRGRLFSPFSGWTRQRDLPLPARSTFRERWSAGRRSP